MESPPLLEVVRRVLADVAARLPRGPATLREARSRGDPGAVDMILVPAHKDDPEICAHVDALEVSLSCGHGAIYEIPACGRRYTGEPFERELRLLCQGIVSGRFEETVWRRGGKVVRSSAEIAIPGGVAVSKWSAVFVNVFARTTKAHYQHRAWHT